ncbi:hypothetical protein [Celeribacter naphthalenivorans]|uniref:hypothetical protein n=1 Tax=Celeribacter naphthalenivorans TaxID=1614694 RepID=UPI001CFB1542|nr:hypothetical protein [Celeribacter naphthalenivorans]
MSLLKKLTASRSAVTDAMDQLDVIRAKNADIQSEIRRLEVAPLPVGEALELFDNWAEKQAEEAFQSLRPELLLDPGLRAGELSLPDFTYVLDGKSGRAHHRADEVLWGLIIATALPSVRSIVEEKVEAAVLGRECLSRQERAEKIERAQVELLEIELVEEGIVRALEASGLDVQRRADADPQAVLASDASLPA